MDAPAPTVTGWLTRITRTPLLGKLVVMDLALNAVAILALQFTPPELQEELTVLSLLVVVVLNVALVGWALTPLAVLEETTRQVSGGDYAARTRMPWMADRNLVRIGDTLDRLLDTVVADRARVRALAAQVVEAGDQERARIARELHDGTAQSLAALDMLLTATLGEVDRASTRERLSSMQQVVSEALEEVRTLCHDVHPRVLDDLGLKAALVSLVRRSRERTEAGILLDDELTEPVRREVESVVYRVVQEAVHNALKHGQPSVVRVHLFERDGTLHLEVTDDGGGFDPAAVTTGTAGGGLGLFVMDERVGLVGGTFGIDSAPGRGTVVRASMQLEEL